MHVACSETADKTGSHSVAALKSEIQRLQAKLKSEELQVAGAKNRTALGEQAAAKERRQIAAARANLSEVQLQVRAAEQDAAEARQELRKLEDEEDRNAREAWERELPAQRLLAATVGLAGVLSIMGPSSFRRVFLALTGPMAGALMVASLFAFIFADSSTTWLDAMALLVVGKGSAVGYMVWVALLAVAFCRWLFAWDFWLFDWVDEVCSADAVSNLCRDTLQKPLLGSVESEERRQHPGQAHGASVGRRVHAASSG
eukprot:CAMPEP_0179260672 /NCGR_PEP_ID=MMETSP0797-20121207/26462_1 /TAXON_ID=47934 /ORGANISM="Dinophysis acuminata, Strain DAEP01" /LENGTH=257 /DNA_ID=CAMNT_0020968763 /DNA_START=133 /DNA_END=902 /DNA_ORIENTATION=-